jgi:hypothetical protein
MFDPVLEFPTRPSFQQNSNEAGKSWQSAAEARRIGGPRRLLF